MLPDEFGEQMMLGGTGAHVLVAGHGRVGLVAHAAPVVTAAVHGDRVTAWARTLGGPVGRG